MVKRINKSLKVVRIVEKNPAGFTIPELALIVGVRPASIRYLVDTGVLVYTGKPSVIRNPDYPWRGRKPMTVRLGKLGREKLKYFNVGGSLPAA